MKSIMFIVLFVGAILQPTSAQAVEEEFAVTMLKNTSCDQRAPRVKVEIGEGARRVGYGYPNSDVIFWLDTHGVTPGVHHYDLQAQPFGSTREWVMVAAFEGSQGLYTWSTLTFERPSKNSCVARQNPRIVTYSLDVNTACMEGFDKLVIASLKVKRGVPGYIVAPGVAEIVKRNDVQLNSTPENTSFVGGVGGAQREVEYYFFTGRRAAFKLDSSENGIWPVKTSSGDVELLASLDAVCMPQVP